MSKQLDKLKTLLMELFQLDQPDLDFGFYRIMHAKADEVTKFLDEDLLPQVEEAFAEYHSADKAELKAQLEKAIEQANSLGVDPESTDKVKGLRATLREDAVDVDALERQVYDHLYRFFRRYYSEGDFLSKRVYKDGVYAIPYQGEEVKLHWANADQYYIKTSEYLRDFAFRLRPDDKKNPMRVHFQLVDAAEGEHGNVKEGNKRVFVLAGDDFIAEEDGQLVLRFEYRPATVADWSDEAKAEATKAQATKPPDQKALVRIATQRILEVTDPALASWLKELQRKAPTENCPDRTVLEKQLTRYTARNTFDYFIHKDLGGFLRRELDFYIKNEVMHLDDIENESAPRVEQYLSQIKVIRSIAGKIIEFLAQLEDFQKRLWLKKKFVVETSWCVRVDLIPEELLKKVCANNAQREEWIQLHAIDELMPGTGSLLEAGIPGYTVPLTPEFLKAHPTLMVDTRHFDMEFNAGLLQVIVDLDQQVDGVLLQSENFQALSLMRTRYRKELQSVYIDPPYNTGADEFAFKDAYQHSSWQAMVNGRLEQVSELLTSDAVLLVSISDIELAALRYLLTETLGEHNQVGTLVWKGATDNNPTRIATEHEYILCWAGSLANVDRHWSTSANEVKQRMLAEFERCRATASSDKELESLFAEFASSHREELGDLYRYRRVDSAGPYVSRRNMENPGKPGYDYDVVHPKSGRPCTKPYWGWRFPEATMKRLLNEDRIIFGEDETKIPELKVYLRDVSFPLRSVFSMDARKGSNDLDRLFGSRAVFKNPKPAELLEYLLPFTSSKSAVTLDFFAGSGTTGHAVINLNRGDGSQRRFILVEMGDYFDTVLLPRLKKVTFSPEWKNGKPKRRATPEEAGRSPRIMKVVLLESYEDTLNNLELRQTEARQRALELAEREGSELREQYLLGYMLNVETRTSQSLLNVDAFTDPTAYRLKVKRPGSDESREMNVDLLETFNWLIGLTVQHLAAPQTFSAEFKRDQDPDLPENVPRRLLLNGRLKPEPEGAWWFRTVTGTLPDGQRALVIWRKRPGGEDEEGIEQDNLVLDEWFKKQDYSSRDSEFDRIYVNGDNNLENLKTAEDTWEVHLIEEDFHRLMFEDTEEVL